MRLIAGLGNPGKGYRFSRHNLGFMTVDRLSRIHRKRIFLPRSYGRTAEIKIGSEKVVLLKPSAYMNRSGESVLLAMKKFNLKSEDLIVLHDDMDLSLGKLKLGFGLSSAGHKGVESIIEKIGTGKFYRIRLGIGKPAEKEDVVSYVLSSFTDEEMEIVKRMIESACQAVEVLIKEGLEKAMNIFHRKN